MFFYGFNEKVSCPGSILWKVSQSTFSIRSRISLKRTWHKADSGQSFCTKRMLSLKMLSIKSGRLNETDSFFVRDSTVITPLVNQYLYQYFFWKCLLISSDFSYIATMFLFWLVIVLTFLMNCFFLSFIFFFYFYYL